MRFRQLLPLFSALFALYIIWGSTYFVIRIGVESWPPLMMAGVRFLAAGGLLTAFLLLRGHKLTPLRPLLNAALIGILLLAVGNGLVTVAEHQNVPSGIAAVVVATVPLFTLCFSHFFGIKTRRLEWLGIAIGLAGIVMLNSGGNLSGNPWGGDINSDRFDQLGVWLRLRFAYYATGGDDGRRNRDARRRDRTDVCLTAQR